MLEGEQYPSVSRVVDTMLGRTDLHFSAKGEQLLTEAKCVAADRDPALWLGGSGLGKTVIAKEIVRQLGYPRLAQTNAYPMMDISLWIGQWQPVTENGALTVKWHDGVLSSCIRNGIPFMLEEITRAPQDAMARFFSVLDDMHRSYSIPEHGGEEVEVHPDFWFLATANPPGGAYATVKLDEAFRSRFSIWEVNEPLADEITLLKLRLSDPKFDGMAERLMAFVTDARRSPTTYVNTRDLMQCAKRIAQGFGTTRAVELSIIPKYDNPDLIKCAELHLSDANPDEVA